MLCGVVRTNYCVESRVIFNFSCVDCSGTIPVRSFGIIVERWGSLWAGSDGRGWGGGGGGTGASVCSLYDVQAPLSFSISLSMCAVRARPYTQKI